jgi:hypothetical protein
VVFDDDKRVVELAAWKEYGTPGATIEVEALDPAARSTS